MDQPATILKKGTRIRTHAKLEDTLGVMVAIKHREARQADALGVIDGVVPGHGGDIYWVRHERARDYAVYCFDEFELAPEPGATCETCRGHMGAYMVAYPPGSGAQKIWCPCPNCDGTGKRATDGD